MVVEIKVAYLLRRQIIWETTFASYNDSTLVKTVLYSMVFLSSVRFQHLVLLVRFSIGVFML